MNEAGGSQTVDSKFHVLSSVIYRVTLICVVRMSRRSGSYLCGD
jgi:hypothetical protein